MITRHTNKRRAPRWVRGSLTVLAVLVSSALGAGAWAYVHLRGSLPQLEGRLTTNGISASVTIVRDAAGVPTIIGRTRDDLAWALGYLHAQERFFQMDGQRRSAAGEIADLVGPRALTYDRSVRVHRFRTRASAVLASMNAAERKTLDAYADGVNRGLAGLTASPFEYLLLWAEPVPWTAEDTILTGYSMYLSLQEADGRTERQRSDALELLGRPWADFLFPEGTSWDTPLDGSTLPQPALPATALPAVTLPQQRAGEVEPSVHGSNAFAVSGTISSHGAAIIANDMHLRLRVPNIWYRARLILDEGTGRPVLDITGVTLPGVPNIVAGSNGQIAWGFTNSYVDTSDVVVVEPVEGDPRLYRSPDGPRGFSHTSEYLCRTCAKPEPITIEETIWGPVIGTDRQGRKLAYRWVAHDVAAINLRAALDLERARTADEALTIAHRMGIPHQNLVAGDREGRIGWTVTTALPQRFGHDGRLPASWADGTRGWSGYLASEEVPVVSNPGAQRLWTANARMVGGDGLSRLGFGAYAHGSRAHQIKEGLFARERFSEQDLLSVQLDDRGLLLERWQGLLLSALQARSSVPKYAVLIPHVEAWGGRAVPNSVGYRIVRLFRSELIGAVYDSYTAQMPPHERGSPSQSAPQRLASNHADEPVWRLLSERPGHLVPAGYGIWEEVIDAALGKVLSAIATHAGGRLDEFTWGAANRTALKHPLSQAVPGLSLLVDPPDRPQAGDVYQPRVAAPAFGASERFVVAPGQETTGIYHMPTGQSGHPLAPYSTSGHMDWIDGRPSPFLPGEPRWRLTLDPS